MSGEINGVREAGERLRERLREMPREWADKKAAEATRRLDQRIREGKVQKPR